MTDGYSGADAAGIVGGVAGVGIGLTGLGGARFGDVGSDRLPHATTLRVMKSVAVPVTMRESPFIPCLPIPCPRYHRGGLKGPQAKSAVCPAVTRRGNVSSNRHAL